MEIIKQFYETVTDKWRNNKGKGTIHCEKPFNAATLIANTIIKVKAKRPDINIFIAIYDFTFRQELIKEFDKLEINHSHITCISQSYVRVNHRYNYDLVITVDINSYSILQTLCNCSKFMLNVITDIKLQDSKTLLKVYNLLSPINTGISSAQAKNVVLCSPVEEHRVSVDISPDDRVEYDKQCAYINNIMIIIGDIRNIDRIKNGDRQLGLSGAAVRDRIARDNGWSESLDMTIPFNKQIDDAYNPTLLYEKACTVYEVIKNRRNLITDNEAKLEAILEIVNKYPNEQIIIISKRGDFASTITKYLNSKNIACVDYHDSIEKAVAVDDNGIPILVKSGPNKGKPKIIGSQAISSANLRAYSQGYARVLSTKNSSVNGLSATCGLWIITSPLCDDIHTIKTKFAELKFTTNPNLIYSIYCSDTIESKAIVKQQSGTLHQIIEDNEKIISIDENSGDIIL